MEQCQNLLRQTLNFIRRLSGVYPISTFLNSSNPLTWTDINIILDMNLTGLNKYYTKTEVNNSLALKHVG